MKLNYYLKTKDRAHVTNFIALCNECNINSNVTIDDWEGSDAIGVGIFIDDAFIVYDVLDKSENEHKESVIFNNDFDDIRQVAALLNELDREEPIYNELVLEPYVHFLGEYCINVTYKELDLSEYESFIRNYDLNKFEDTLYTELTKCKETYPQFTIGCKMTTNLDLEYNWFQRNLSKTFILRGYNYCLVTEKWGPITDRGYGDFSAFMLENKNNNFYDIKELKLSEQ